MRTMNIRQMTKSGAKACLIGLVLGGLVSCSQGDSTTTTVTSSSSAALQGPIVFVANIGDKTLTSVALRGILAMPSPARSMRRSSEM